MASRMAKLDDKLLTELQKLKVQMYEKYKHTVSISDIVQMLLDQDVLLMNLIKNNKR